MTPEQINKAAEEYGKQFPPHLQKSAVFDFIRGANHALSHSRQEIEKAKEQLRIQQECTNRSEANLRESILQLSNQLKEKNEECWRHAIEHNKAEAENDKLREALKNCLDELLYESATGAIYLQVRTVQPLAPERILTARKLIEG